MISTGLFVLCFAAEAVVAPRPAAPANDEPGAALLAIRRVHVEKLGGGEVAVHMRDMIIASLQRSGLFLITENPEKADAILKGSGEDLVYTDKFDSSEGINAHVGSSTGTTDSTYNRSSNSGTLSNSSGSSSTTGRHFSANAGVGENESVHRNERKHEAVAAVRLVTKDGDVVWSTTQESLGGKFRGASPDVADKIVKQLVEDMQKARKRKASSAANANPLPR